MKLTGFHVQAIGWLLVFNASAVRPQEAPELSRLWKNVVRARGQDLRMAQPLRCLLGPQSMRLSSASLAAMAELLDYMASVHPERFGLDPLRRRRNYWLFQVAFGFSLSFLAAWFLPKSWPLVQEIVPTLVIMSFASVLPLITLWRTVVAVRYVSARRLETTATRLRARLAPHYP
jgi:hypothetical protein